MATTAPGRAPRRVVFARYAHHVWHVDLSLVSTEPGLWVSWFPFSLVQRWPFCWWVAALVDHFSRAVGGSAVFDKEPSGLDLCAVIERAVADAGRAPRHIVSDKGPQFRQDYQDWCKRHDVRPRCGALGQHGSIAVIERFWRSMKQECGHQILVPLARSAMQAELAAYVLWFNRHRPHTSLGGATPQERLEGQIPARDEPAWEPRTSYPLARGDPATPRRRLQGRLELVVSYLDGRRHLPIVELREAA